MEENLGEILKDQDAESDTGKWENIGRHDEEQMESSVSYLGTLFFTLDTLKVKFRKHVNPIGDLEKKQESTCWNKSV